MYIYIYIYPINWLDEFCPLTVATSTRVTYQTLSSRLLHSRALLMANMRKNYAKPRKNRYVQQGFQGHKQLGFNLFRRSQSAIQFGAQMTEHCNINQNN